MGGLLSNSAAVADIEARHLERQKRRAEVSRRAIQSLLDKAAGDKKLLLAKSGEIRRLKSKQLVGQWKRKIDQYIIKKTKKALEHAHKKGDTTSFEINELNELVLSLRQDLEDKAEACRVAVDTIGDLEDRVEAVGEESRLEHERMKLEENRLRRQIDDLARTSARERQDASMQLMNLQASLKTQRARSGAMEQHILDLQNDKEILQAERQRLEEQIVAREAEWRQQQQKQRDAEAALEWTRKENELESESKEKAKVLLEALRVEGEKILEGLRQEVKAIVLSVTEAQQTTGRHLFDELRKFQNPSQKLNTCSLVSKDTSNTSSKKDHISTTTTQQHVVHGGTQHTMGQWNVNGGAAAIPIGVTGLTVPGPPTLVPVGVGVTRQQMIPSFTARPIFGSARNRKAASSNQKKKGKNRGEKVAAKAAATAPKTGKTPRPAVFERQGDGRVTSKVDGSKNVEEYDEEKSEAKEQQHGKNGIQREVNEIEGTTKAQGVAEDVEENDGDRSEVQQAAADEEASTSRAENIGTPTKRQLQKEYASAVVVPVVSSPSEAEATACAVRKNVEPSGSALLSQLEYVHPPKGLDAVARQVQVIEEWERTKLGTQTKAMTKDGNQHESFAIQTQTTQNNEIASSTMSASLVGSDAMRLQQVIKDSKDQLKVIGLLYRDLAELTVSDTSACGQVENGFVDALL